MLKDNHVMVCLRVCIDMTMMICAMTPGVAVMIEIEGAMAMMIGEGMTPTMMTVAGGGTTRMIGQDTKIVEGIVIEVMVLW